MLVYICVFEANGLHIYGVLTSSKSDMRGWAGRPTRGSWKVLLSPENIGRGKWTPVERRMLERYTAEAQPWRTLKLCILWWFNKLKKLVAVHEQKWSSGSLAFLFSSSIQLRGWRLLMYLGDYCHCIFMGWWRPTVMAIGLGYNPPPHTGSRQLSKYKRKTSS